MKNLEATCEHVVQEAIGGCRKDSIDVCFPCNRELSIIDEVLTVQSPLAILARRELGAMGPPCWNVDHGRNNLLLEARATVGSDALVPGRAWSSQRRIRGLGEGSAYQSFMQRNAAIFSSTVAISGTRQLRLYE